MSEDSEMWNKIHEDGKAKRWRNAEWSIQFLKDLGIAFRVLNEESSHYRVGDFDFWPTTGKFYNQKTGQKGRGVKNLIKTING